MDRKATARETVEIMRQGYYEVQKGDRLCRIDVLEDMRRSVEGSILITPEQGEEILEEGLGQYFEKVFYAVLYTSRGQRCIVAFREILRE